MSAILSADDLNDFISPGVACIKPIETLATNPALAVDPLNPYSVNQEDKQPATTNKTAQISLTDCLACSGCVTSAEAVLVSLQSHREVLENLRAHSRRIKGDKGKKTFVALLSPQTVASLAAAFGVSKNEARWMVDWLLKERVKTKIKGAGNNEDGGGGDNWNNGFKWVLDTDVGRDIGLVYGFEEVWGSIGKNKTTAGENEGEEMDAQGKERTVSISRRLREEGKAEAEKEATTDENCISVPTRTPILTSACPGFICYVENTHPYLIPYLSRLKSPQAILGTMIKSLLPRLILQEENLVSLEGPESIYIVSIQPCFDRKLEGARGELTSSSWLANGSSSGGIRDVDCVITTRELIALADECGIEFSSLPRRPLDSSPSSLAVISRLLGLDDDLATSRRISPSQPWIQYFEPNMVGTSGGYLYYILFRLQQNYPGSQISIHRGRNSDTTEYNLFYPASEASSPAKTILTLSRSYGFRNIQNLVRKLKPIKPRALPSYGKKSSVGRIAAGLSSNRLKGQRIEKEKLLANHAYVEVMACPGGCTNGGGQIKFDDERISGSPLSNSDTYNNKEWLSRVDEAYWSSEESADKPESESEAKKTTKPLAFINSSNSPFAPFLPIPNEDQIKNLACKWSELTNVPIRTLLYTSYKKVQDEFNKDRRVESDDDEKETKSARRVAQLAIKEGSGW